VAKAEPLKLIQQSSTGYDNIDIKACTDRGILWPTSNGECWLRFQTFPN